MPYQYGEPIRAEDGVLFRVENHGLDSFLFRVDHNALKRLSDIAPYAQDPLDSVPQGYAAHLPQQFPDSDNRMDTLDIYNKYRDVIHKAADSLITAGARGDPIVISPDLLEREYRDQ